MTDERGVAFCSPDLPAYEGMVFDVWRRRRTPSLVLMYELVAVVGDEKTALLLTEPDGQGHRYVWEPRRP